MAELTMKLGDRTYQSQLGAGQRVIDAFFKNDLDALGYGDCGGNGCCGTCHVYVVEGAEHFGKQTMAEDILLGHNALAQNNSRLACQLFVTPEHKRIVVEIVQA